MQCLAWVDESSRHRQWRTAEDRIGEVFQRIEQVLVQLAERPPKLESA